MTDSNPFFAFESNGQRFYHLVAYDRISCVKKFDRAQCDAALLMPDLQKTVEQAVRRRIRQLDRGKA